MNDENQPQHLPYASDISLPAMTLAVVLVRTTAIGIASSAVWEIGYFADLDFSTSALVVPQWRGIFVRFCLFAGIGVFLWIRAKNIARRVLQF